MTSTQALGVLVLLLLIVCVAYDLVFCRPVRRERNGLAQLVHELHHALEDAEQRAAIRPLADRGGGPRRPTAARRGPGDG